MRNLKNVLIAKEISVLACYAKLKSFFWETRPRVVPDKRKFWKTVSPLFFEKALHKEFTILINKKTISNNESLSKLAVFFTIF